MAGARLPEDGGEMSAGCTFDDGSSHCSKGKSSACHHLVPDLASILGLISHRPCVYLHTAALE